MLNLFNELLEIVLRIIALMIATLLNIISFLQHSIIFETIMILIVLIVMLGLIFEYIKQHQKGG